MKDKIFVAVIAALLTAAAFWLMNKLALIPSYITIPSGAVVAFESENCPVGGWKEYKPAYGRFIRGIDKSGTNIDPNPSRAPGSLQNDEFKAHTHEVDGVRGTWRIGGDDSGERVNSKARVESTSTGGPETRPKNVALLFCQKL